MLYADEAGAPHCVNAWAFTSCHAEDGPLHACHFSALVRRTVAHPGEALPLARHPNARLGRTLVDQVWRSRGHRRGLTAPSCPAVRRPSQRLRSIGRPAPGGARATRPARRRRTSSPPRPSSPAAQSSDSARSRSTTPSARPELRERRREPPRALASRVAARTSTSCAHGTRASIRLTNADRVEPGGAARPPPTRPRPRGRRAARAAPRRAVVVGRDVPAPGVGDDAVRAQLARACRAAASV